MKSLVLTLCLCSWSVLAFAQNRSMGSDGILGRLQTVIDAAEERDMEVVRIEADIIRTTKESIRTLDPSYTYTIIAVGSERIADLDIEVYKMIDGDWTLVKKDTDDQNVAGVEIKPSAYAEYKVVIKAYKFVEGQDVGHYGLAYIHD
jgi:hypothetical protein